MSTTNVVSIAPTRAINMQSLLNDLRLLCEQKFQNNIIVFCNTQELAYKCRMNFENCKHRYCTHVSVYLKSDNEKYTPSYHITVGENSVISRTEHENVFTNWVASVIDNQLALRYAGKLIIGGVSKKPNSDMYTTFAAHLKKLKLDKDNCVPAKWYNEAVAVNMEFAPSWG